MPRGRPKNPVATVEVTAKCKGCSKKFTRISLMGADIPMYCMKCDNKESR